MKKQDKDNNELNLSDLFFILYKRRKLIKLVTLPIFGLGIFFAITRPTIFEAKMTMMVSSNQNFANSLDGKELSVNHKLATTYAEIAKSDTILKNVIKKYDLDVNLKLLQSNVKIIPIENTELLQLKYTHTDPALVAAIVNEIGNEFMSKVHEVMNFQNIKVIELAEIPRDALPKKCLSIISASLLFSIFIGFLTAIVVDFFFYKLRKISEIEKTLRTSQLGVVPYFDFSSGGKSEK